VTRGHRDIISELTGIAFTELVFTGGAAKGSLWPQIIADVTGALVHVPVVTESSALGAAICAGVGAGIYGGLTDLEHDLRARSATFGPGAAAVALYDEAYPNWRQVYRRMLDLCEDGLLSPLWRAAGAETEPAPANLAQLRRH
jgi:autoinducer-2 kinase